MHLSTLNILDLMISLWCGTLDCTKPDDKSNWDWAVLKGEIWKDHGKAVANALHCPAHLIVHRATLLRK
jgi:hypothetical protein